MLPELAQSQANRPESRLDRLYGILQVLCSQEGISNQGNLHFFYSKIRSFIIYNIFLKNKSFYFKLKVNINISSLNEIFKINICFN